MAIARSFRSGMWQSVNPGCPWRATRAASVGGDYGSAAGRVTSTTSAPRKASRSADARCRFTPWAPPPIATSSVPDTLASAITGQAVDAPNGVIVPRSYPVAALRLVGVGEREPAHAEVRAELRPVDLPAARHQHEHVVAGAAAHDDRAQELVQLDPLERRALLGARGRAVRTGVKREIRAPRAPGSPACRSVRPWRQPIVAESRCAVVLTLKGKGPPRRGSCWGGPIHGPETRRSRLAWARGAERSQRWRTTTTRSSSVAATTGSSRPRTSRSTARGSWCSRRGTRPAAPPTRARRGPRRPSSRS